jgi:methyltransferase (TIGR00027 family)
LRETRAVQNISDTARWAAWFRAEETKRPDALFRDPFAERLAGAHGARIANTLPEGNQHAWAWVARTYAFDEFIGRCIHEGSDMVINLAAGLDARPYRMALPPSLQWMEVDLPEILSYKQQILAAERPACVLDRIRLDLSKVDERRSVFRQFGERARKAVVITEGLLIYLKPEQVAALARDLADVPSFAHWIVDIVSPGLLRMMQRTSGRSLSAVGAPFQFGPMEGPGFFAPNGWQTEQVSGLLKTAARFKRPPLALRLLAHLPEPQGTQGNRPWSGVCLLKKTQP